MLTSQAMMSSSAPRRTVAIVVNPSKFDDLDAIQAEVTAFFTRPGWADPLWFETGREDSGVAAAEAALKVRADLVCVMGGDGTVRAVASVLRGTGMPLGLLPSGTGNLLARNLGISIDSLEDALQVALLGQDLAMDVGLATLDDHEERVFLVMGGVGLDADIMDQTDDTLKKRVGWGAYVVAGGANLFKRGFGAAISVDGADEPSKDCLMVLVCNCSSVVANIELAAGAQRDDGKLDLVMLRPNVVAGWVGVAIDVAARKRNGWASLRQWAGRTFSLELDRPVLAELDGDAFGPTRNARFDVDPGALVVRIPVPRKRPRNPPAQATDPANEEPLISAVPASGEEQIAGDA